MMTIEDVRAKLNKMKSHFQSGFSCTEQEFLEDLNQLFFRKPISNKGCQDCYRDAYIILSNKIKNMEELPKRSAYILKAGIVKHKFGTSDYYALDMPEEAAEDWLRQYPDDIVDFQAYPDDWQQRIQSTYSVTEKPTERKRGRKPSEK